MLQAHSLPAETPSPTAPHPPPGPLSPPAPGVRTGQHGRAAVLGHVLRPLGHVRAAGLRLVGAQGLPLLPQPVLVLQMVLHVGLRRRRGVRAPPAGPRGATGGRTGRGGAGTDADVSCQGKGTVGPRVGLWGQGGSAGVAGLGTHGRSCSRCHSGPDAASRGSGNSIAHGHGAVGSGRNSAELTLLPDLHLHRDPQLSSAQPGSGVCKPVNSRERQGRAQSSRAGPRRAAARLRLPLPGPRRPQTAGSGQGRRAPAPSTRPASRPPSAHSR